MEISHLGNNQLKLVIGVLSKWFRDVENYDPES